MYNEMVDYIRSLQLSITQGIEELEAEVAPRGVTPVKFLQDSWERANNGGSGTSCVIQGGTVMEKGGVNVSVVHGRLPPRAGSSNLRDLSLSLHRSRADVPFSFPPSLFEQSLR